MNPNLDTAEAHELTVKRGVFGSKDLLDGVERLKMDVKICRSTSEAVHYYGQDKNRLADDIELVISELERLRK